MHNVIYLYVIHKSNRYKYGFIDVINKSSDISIYAGEFMLMWKHSSVKHRQARDANPFRWSLTVRARNKKQAHTASRFNALQCINSFWIVVTAKQSWPLSNFQFQIMFCLAFHFDGCLSFGAHNRDILLHQKWAIQEKISQKSQWFECASADLVVHL